MKTVSVSELKAHLSRYLREVRRGSEIQVLDRGIPVARLTQPGGDAGDIEERRQRLARAGVLRLGSGRAAKVVRLEPLDLGVPLSDAIADDRDDRL
jgi:antitoxin (DNA-binding transcriptional repressor) of toxin-antitoxin stability system